MYFFKIYADPQLNFLYATINIRMYSKTTAFTISDIILILKFLERFCQTLKHLHVCGVWA